MATSMYTTHSVRMKTELFGPFRKVRKWDFLCLAGLGALRAVRLEVLFCLP